MPTPSPTRPGGVAHWLATSPWVARFDLHTLRPIEGQARAMPHTDAERAAWAAARDWCESGMGDGRAPLWRPWAPPLIPAPFDVALLLAEHRAGATRLAEALACTLDRNDELAALAERSRGAALRLKLAVKWHELWWWRVRHAQQPWDCGHLGDDATAWTRFRPRRPTLILAEGLPTPRLAEAVQAFEAASPGYRHPVRLLLIDSTVPEGITVHPTIPLHDDPVTP